MKNKPLIFMLILSVTALGSYFVYRNFQQKKVTQQQKIERNRIVDLAKRSPKAGLAEMGRAIKRYHGDKKSYPKDLKLLFPEYIKTEALIHDVNWTYKPTGKGFYLSKSIVIKGQRITAAIDDSLRFKADEKIMLASLSQKKVSEQRRKNVPKIKKSLATMISKVDKVDSMNKAGGLDRFDDDRTLLSSNNQDQSLKSLKEKIEMVSVKNPPSAALEIDQGEIITEPLEKKEPVLVAKVIESKAKLIADTSDRYLVWISRDGHLGFSNIQYPKSEKIGYYYLEGKWESAMR